MIQTILSNKKKGVKGPMTVVSTQVVWPFEISPLCAASLPSDETSDCENQFALPPHVHVKEVLSTASPIPVQGGGDSDV